MKVLWIVNSLLNKFSINLYNKPSRGLWMDALLEEFKGKYGYEIVVATTQKIKKTIKYVDENVTYYALPDTVPLLYNENKKNNIRAWESLIAEEKPDLIQVWGTEFTHGLCALRIAKQIPSVIYMQGYIGAISRYYQAGIPYSEIKRTCTFRDVIKRDSILQRQEKYFKQAKKEAEMLALSDAAIYENTWCATNLQAIVPDLKIYHLPLSINKVFYDYRWDIDKANKFSIICTASGYTIKGLHMLLEAIAILKRKYPEIKLYVPGTPQVSDGSLKWFIRKKGYTKYIENLIKKLDIKSNIVWLGTLSQEDLAKEYTKHRVFVMPSAIENHSSSLKEAMIVGMPCVSSDVGGVSEYLVHGKNGLLYRFEEYAVLADYVSKLFDDDKLAQTLSENARKDVIDLHGGTQLFDRITEIYKDIISGKK